MSPACILSLGIVLLGCHGNRELECGLAASGRESSQPNLSIAVEPLTGEPIISPNKVRIRNLGEVIGIASISATLIDDSGHELSETLVRTAAQIPPVDLGGEHGITITLKQDTELSRSATRLLSTATTFGMLVKVNTLGGDADEEDNSSTRHFGVSSKRIHNSSSRSIRLPNAMRSKLLRTSAAANSFDDNQRPSSFAHDAVGERSNNIQRLPRYLTTNVVRNARDSVRHFFSECLSERESSTFEGLVTSDTTPPQIRTFRGVLFDDGTLGVHLFLSDQHSGVAASGVRLLYRKDTSEAWTEKYLWSSEDDYGRPSVFEGFIEPFAGPGRLRLRIAAFDRAGNATQILPDDAMILRAPQNAQHLIHNSKLRSPFGHLLLLPEVAQKQVVEYHELKRRLALDSLGGTYTQSADRLTMTQLEDLRALKDVFRAANVDVRAFRRVGKDEYHIRLTMSEKLSELTLSR